MSEKPKNGRRDLAEILLGAPLVAELAKRGVRPRFLLEGGDGTEEAGSLINRLEERASHQNRLAAMGELGAGVVHEARNRATAIRGFADLARRRPVSPHVKGLLDRIFAEIEASEASLSAFLGFVRSGAGGDGPFDITGAIDKAAVLARHQLEIHGVALDVESAGDLPMGHGNATEFSQVLVNLALNAQQAMPEGGRVVIRSRVNAAGAIIVEVADDGPGVPLEHRERIFEPFFTTKPADGGTGLGLALCSQLVSSWDGTLEVGDSELGGALFTVGLVRADQENH